MIDHFYTTDPSGETALASGYFFEGIPGYVFPSQEPDTVPIYRFFSAKTGDHFYTRDPNGEIAPQISYVKEGDVAWWMYSSARAGTTALYRWYGNGDHFYTTDPNGELAPKLGYSKEGIIGYICTGQTPRAVPLQRLATGIESMPYQNKAMSAPTVFNAEWNGVWTMADFNGDGTQDLVYIKRYKPASGKVELHVSRNESRFQESTYDRATCFDAEDNGTWLMQDWTRDGKADLVYIKWRNTSSGMVELYVADAASDYQNFALNTSTCFGLELGWSGTWTMSKSGDLVYIKNKNCGSGNIEYHVASKASNYKQFTYHVATSLGMEDNGIWCLGPQSSGGLDDLYYIKTRNTGTGRVEVHALSASSNWQSRLLGVISSLPLEGEEQGTWNGVYLVAPFSHQSKPDLVYVKVKNCASGKAEVTVVQPEKIIPKPYADTARNVYLTNNTSNVVTLDDNWAKSGKTILRAELKRNDGTWRDAAVDLNMFLGNIDGKFTWRQRAFSQTAQSLTMDGSVLCAQLKNKNGSWVQARYELRNSLLNNDGVFEAVQVPALLVLSPESEKKVLEQIEKSAETDPNFKFQVFEEPDGATTFYINGSVHTDGVLLKSVTAETRASLMHISGKHGVDVEVLTVGTSVSVGSYTGFEVGVSLFKGGAAGFEIDLGVGLDTGIGIKDDSFSVELEGCGFTIGRKIGISVFGASLSLDFGGLLDLF